MQPGGLSEDTLYIIRELETLRNERSGEMKQFTEALSTIRNDIHEIKGNMKEVSVMQMDHQKLLTRLETIISNHDERIKILEERINKTKEVFFIEIDKAKNEIWEEMRNCQGASNQRDEKQNAGIKDYVNKEVKAGMSTLKIWVLTGILTVIFGAATIIIKELSK